jgi:uncharacterized protein (TIGR00251 family)
MIPIRDTDEGCSFQVRLQPRARKSGFQGESGEALKVAVNAPPIEGRANAALIEYLAEFLKVSRRSVTIASGERSRLKMVRVQGVSAEEARRRFSPR